jgi:hypothetical protein
MAYSLATIDSCIDTIRETTENGVGGIENYAKWRAYREPVDEYEQALVNQSDNLEYIVHSQVDDIKQVVFSRRPRVDDPHYQWKQKQFVEFTKHATNGITGLKGTFGTLFSKVKNVIQTIASWIRDNFNGIVQKIGTIFRTVVMPILHATTGGGGGYF